MYTETGIIARRSNRRIVVVTVLTRKTSLTSPLVFDIATLLGTSTPSIEGAWAGDRAQLTCGNGLVFVIIVFNVGNAPCAPFGL